MRTTGLSWSQQVGLALAVTIFVFDPDLGYMSPPAQHWLGAAAESSLPQPPLHRPASLSLTRLDFTGVCCNTQTYVGRAEAPRKALFLHLSEQKPVRQPTVRDTQHQRKHMLSDSYRRYHCCTQKHCEEAVWSKDSSCVIFRGTLQRS